MIREQFADDPSPEEEMEWTLERLRELVKLAWQRWDHVNEYSLHVCPVCNVVIPAQRHASDCDLAEVVGLPTKAS